MRTLRTTVAVALALCFAALWDSNAKADETRGNELHDTCKASLDSPDGGFCFGYIIGVHEMMHVAIAAAQAPDLAATLVSGYCPPPQATNIQLRDIVATYLRAHPEHRHQAAATLVMAALIYAFPCQ